MPNLFFIMSQIINLITVVRPQTGLHFKSVSNFLIFVPKTWKFTPTLKTLYIHSTETEIFITVNNYAKLVLQFTPKKLAGE